VKRRLMLDIRLFLDQIDSAVDESLLDRPSARLILRRSVCLSVCICSI
jgi:hypothetical protein